MSEEKRTRANKAQAKILHDWLSAHRMNPYPSTAEKKKLAQESGLTIDQVRKWFENKRKSDIMPTTALVQKAAAERVKEAVEMDTEEEPPPAYSSLEHDMRLKWVHDPSVSDEEVMLYFMTERKRREEQDEQERLQRKQMILAAEKAKADARARGEVPAGDKPHQSKDSMLDLILEQTRRERAAEEEEA